MVDRFGLCDDCEFVSSLPLRRTPRMCDRLNKHPPRRPRRRLLCQENKNERLFLFLFRDSNIAHYLK